MNEYLNLKDLPDNFYYYLFKFLNLEDIIKVKLLSKTFYSIVVASNPITELSFLNCNSKYYYYCPKNYNSNWFSTTESIKLKYQFDFSKFSILRNRSNDFLNLRRLKITNKDKLISIRFKDLNVFIQLRILDISEVYTRSDDCLKLPNLNALSFTFKTKVANHKLMIDTPNLYSLCIRKRTPKMIGNLITFKHPLAVRYLLSNEFSENLSLIFENLECLELYEYPGRSKMYHILQSDNLKTFKLNADIKDLDPLKHLYWSREKTLKIFYYGVRIKTMDKFEQFCNQFYFQVGNYDDLENNLHFVDSLNYEDLIDFYSHRLPADLFDKYTNIRKLSILRKVKEEKVLVDFIRNCPALYELEIKVSYSLSQQFYDRLYAISSISKLILGTENINLAFVSKLTYLIELYIFQRIRIGEDFDLNELNYLKRFSFVVGDVRFTVVKLGKDRYMVIYASEYLYDPLHFTLKGLIKWTRSFCNRKQNQWLYNLESYNTLL